MVGVIARVAADQMVAAVLVEPDGRQVVFAHFEPQRPLSAAGSDALGVGEQPATEASATVPMIDGDGIEAGNGRTLPEQNEMVALKFPTPDGNTEARALAIDEPAKTAAGHAVRSERPRLQGAETFQVLVLRVTNYHA